MVNDLLILAYHRVGKPDAGARYRGQFVTPAHLAFQVRWLQKRGYRFQTLTNALNTEGKRAVVTFDDGYRNNLTLGLPALQRLGVPATVFVVTKDVGKRNMIWPEAGETNPAELLTWDELRQLQKVGWEIGSHCSEHVHLANKSLEEQESLIASSLTTLRLELAADPIPFAYPYGSYNEMSVKVMAKLGCSCAVSMRPGTNKDISDLYALRRIPMKGYRFDHYLRALFWLGGLFHQS